MKSKSIVFGILSLGVLLLVTSCSSASTPNQGTPSPQETVQELQPWTAGKKLDIVNSCTGEESRAFCECLVDQAEQIYASPTLWEIDLEKNANFKGMSDNLMEVQAQCEARRKLGMLETETEPDEPAQEVRPNYPPCVQVLAPGNSGLTINDNKRVLGREDGQPGYCVLPNSGGELYYYPGR